MITGSRGFLGISVQRYFEDSNHSIIHFDINDGDDILDSSKLIKKLEDVDLCVHLAAVADLYHAEEDKEKCYLINTEGTFRVAEACARMNVRLIFISTVCAYGNNGCKIQFEDSPLEPTEIYDETKALAEKKLTEVANLNFRIIRPATFYGPTMRESLAIHRFVKACKSNTTIEIHGLGNQTRCYTHVDDVASAILIIAEKWPPELIFNVANSTSYSVNQIVEIIEQISGKELDVVYVDDREGQIFSSVINVNRIMNLGWTPKYDINLGLTELLL